MFSLLFYMYKVFSDLAWFFCHKSPETWSRSKAGHPNILLDACSSFNAERTSYSTNCWFHLWLAQTRRMATNGRTELGPTRVQVWNLLCTYLSCFTQLCKMQATRENNIVCEVWGSRAESSPLEVGGSLSHLKREMKATRTETVPFCASRSVRVLVVALQVMLLLKHFTPRWTDLWKTPRRLTAREGRRHY